MKVLIMTGIVFLIMTFGVSAEGLRCDQQELVTLGECIEVPYYENFFQRVCWQFDLNYDWIVNLSDIGLYAQECRTEEKNEKIRNFRNDVTIDSNRS